MAENGLVLRQPQVEESHSDFFKEAYAAACRAEPDRRDSDRELLQGCVAQICQEYALDVSLREGQAESIRLLGIFMSLGLEVAAESSRERATALLREQPITVFVELGMSLHDELRDRAKSVLAKSILSLSTGLYGLLEAADERELERISRKETFFADRESFADADGKIRFDEQTLELAAHLPMKFIFEGGSFHVAFQVQAYRRLNARTPSARGGLFFLCLRSCMLYAMTAPFEYPVLHNGMEIKEFLERNMVGKADAIRRLIIESFFDPKALVALIPAAAEKVTRIFDQRIHVRDFQIGTWTSPERKTRGWQKTLLDIMARVLTEFAKAVREYFVTKDEATISSDEMQRFWNPYAFIRAPTGPRAGGDEINGDTIMNARDDDMIASINDVATILRLPEEKIFTYVDAMVDWPADKKRIVLDRYKWNKVLDNIADELLQPALARLVKIFSAEFLRKLSHQRFTLLFWMQAWKDEPTLRDAILQYFTEGRFPKRIGSGGLISAVKGAYGVGGDGRLFVYLLAVVMREIPGEYLAHVNTEEMRQAIWSLIDHPPSLQALVARIRPSQLALCLDKLTHHDKARYLTAMSSRETP